MPCSAVTMPRFISLNGHTDEANTRVRTATAKEYVDAIAFHAKQTTGTSLYPGYIFEDLSLFLESFTERVENENENELPTAGKEPVLATVFTIRNGDLNRQSFSKPLDCVRSLEHGTTIRTEQQPQARIIFLRGYPTPEWIAYLGSFCNIDPAFFQSHLNFRCRRDWFSTPSLNSTTENIVTLKVITIGSRESKRGESHQDSVDKLREEGASLMHKYEHELMVGTRFSPGDSIVRGYSILDEKHFVIEQSMSICISKAGKYWRAIVCTDVGNDLSEGVKGPWLTQADRPSHPWTMFYPTIQHLPRIALRLEPTSSSRPNFDSKVESSKFPQSASLLAQDFGEHLDKQLMKLDAFYSINELFRFCAFSNAQFLGILEATINTETSYSSLAIEKPTLTNLLYCQRILERLLPTLQRNIQVIKQRGSASWPHVSEEHKSQYARAEAAAEALLRDMEGLEQRTKALLERCKTGMNVLMNYVMLAESKQAIAQGQRVGKLTFLAFLYIPLSFTTSVFGMNIKQMNSSGLSIWVWVVTSVLLFAFSVSFLFLDKERVKNMCQKVWKKMLLLV